MPPAVVGVAVGVVMVGVMVWALVDLGRHDVAFLPKWAWAVGIVVLSVVGAAAYAVVGRVPATGGQPVITRLVGGGNPQASGDAEHELMLVGMVLGLLIGTALGQLALGMAVGLAVGAAADAWRSHRAGRR